MLGHGRSLVSQQLDVQRHLERTQQLLGAPCSALGRDFLVEEALEKEALGR